MRIVAPAARVEEVAALAEAGADEIYCGVVPRDWTERFGSSGVNRRIFGNLTSYDDLQAAVDAAGSRDVPLSLVLNAQHYGEAHMDALLELSHRFAAMGGAALIVGDAGLLALLAQEGPGIRLHASSLLACRNTEAAAFYRALGADRVIFPRDVTVAEMTAITAARPDIEFEAFVLNDGCVFEEGTCHTIHLPGRLGGPICLDRYGIAYERRDGTPPDEHQAAALAKNDARYDEWLWFRFGCGFSVTAEGYPYGPCGLCALPPLAAGGVTSIKIAGREAPLPRKLKAVEMVRAVRDSTLLGDADQTLALARGMRGQPELCHSGYMCYYREVMPGGLRRAIAVPRLA